MQFESSFVVSGTPERVILCFQDVPLMAGFLPGASVGAADPDGRLPATLAASFGPKRITFHGTLTSHVDTAALAGDIAGQASADVRGARMAVKMRYQLSPAGDGRTRVQLHSDAQLTGILAEFAKAGGVVVAEALIAEFARGFSAYLDGASANANANDAPPPPRAATLSTGTLLMALLRRLRSWMAGTA